MPEVQSKAKRTYIIRLGNHWLQADDHLEFPKFVQCPSQATLHTRKWADGYAKQQLRENRRVNVLTFEDALRIQQRVAHDALKCRWLWEFYKRTRATCGDRIQSTGIWANAHMYYDHGVTVDEAVTKVAKSFGVITR